MTKILDREQTRAAMQEVMGPLPTAGRQPPAAEETETTTAADGVVYRKLRFSPEAGDDCWAWLLLPPAAAAGDDRPAMLCLHQTTRIGKDEPAGLGGLADLHYGLELARRGYVVLAPDYPRFGDYQIDVYAMGYGSATIKGVWNHVRALDLLAAMPGVDAARIGCIGHSLGAHNALFLAAFDERIKTVVASCGFTRWTWNDDEGRGQMGDLSDWSHGGYMPRIADVYKCRAENMPFDFTDVLAAIAPRPTFINAPLQDFFRVEGVKECVEIVRDRFAPEDLVVHHPDCKHSFPPAVRVAAYAWLDTQLAGAVPD